MPENEFWKVTDKNFKRIVWLYNSRMELGFEVEVFKKFLDKEFDINYKIPSSSIVGDSILIGKTIFQLVHLVACDPNLCQVLIDHGADYTITDDSGSTNLLNKTSAGYKQYLSSLKLMAAKGKFCANVILSAHINSQNPKNPKDKDGLSHFHVACMYNRVDAAKFFLENGVPINETVKRNSAFCPGYSALHFAVMSWAIETVELLLTLGADVFAKDIRGMNPLQVLIADRREIFCILKRITRIALSNEEKSKFSNLFEYYSKSEKIIYLLLSEMKEFDCYLDDDTGLSYFHVLCLLGNTSSVKQMLDNNREYLTESVNINSPVWSGYTPLHFAAHSNVETVELLVRNGANISAKDANGATPFDICLREFSLADVHRIFCQEPIYSNIVFSDGKTRLSDFIKSMQEDVTFESFLKENLTDPNMFIPFESPLCAGYTPLHLTIASTGQPMSWNSKKCDYIYSLRQHAETEIPRTYLSRINLCLRYNPDVTCKDAQGTTPLHWAFRLQQSQAVRMLLERHETNFDCVDEHGLSHLHIACAAKNETVIEKLLSGAANVNGVATSSYTWKDADYRGFIKEYFINEGSTPLHFAVSAECVKVVEILISHSVDVLAIDADGLNPLERLFRVPIFRDSECTKPSDCYFNKSEIAITELLVREVGDRLAETKPKQMLYCYSLLETKLLSDVLSLADDSTMKILKTVGIKALHVACFTQNMELVHELVNEVDVNAHADLESPLWPGYTPLHLFAVEKPSNQIYEGDFPPNEAILDELLRNGAAVAAVNAKGDTPIHQLFSLNRYSKFVIKMLEHLKDFSVNPTSSRGYTHLHVASACGDVSTVEKLLEHGALIEQPTNYFPRVRFITRYRGFTALHLAVAYQCEGVVQVLLKHGADVNRKNSSEETPLHVASGVYHVQRNLQISQTLIENGADIHAKDMYGRTPLEVLIKSGRCTKEEVQMFLACGSRVNTVNPITEKGLLAIALKQSKVLSIFEMFIKTPNVKDVDDNERNAIHNAVFYKRSKGRFAFMWNRETNTSYDDNIIGINALINLGLDIDHQDCKGSTPLHIAAQMQNHTGIVGLLENGADIDIVDADGKLAFAYSLELAPLHEELTERDLDILDTVLMHMHKLNMASIGISRLNREIFARLDEQIALDPFIIEQCNNEIERMRKEDIISSSITFYGFLSDTGAISAFPYMLPCIRMTISSYFKDNIKSLRKMFPQWTGILLLQYRKALIRGDMIDDAVSSLNVLLDFDIPILCSRVILGFLSNDELINLKNSTANEYHAITN